MSGKAQIENITVDQAIEKVLSLNLERSVIEVPVPESAGLVLASDANAQNDTPAFDNSAMDGFLFHKSDLDSGRRTFKIKGEIRPENRQQTVYEPGFSVRIMTGAKVPGDEFFVIPVELISENEGTVTVNDVPDKNPIRKKGEGYKSGISVLRKGTLIRPYELGLLIESGNKTCKVYEPVNIALQVTGSEINKENNTNGPVLAGIMKHWPGVKVTEFPVLSDDPEKVSSRMKGLVEKYDMVITTGGISAGRHDYILSAMTGLGARTIIRKVQQKPGKPFTVTTLDGVPCFHLPGNPISAVFTAEYYVRVMLNIINGMNPVVNTAITEMPLKNLRGTRTLFVTGKLGRDEKGRLSVRSKGFMKSHLLQLYTGNDVYVRLDPGDEFHKGDQVRIIPFSTTYLP